MYLKVVGKLRPFEVWARVIPWRGGNVSQGNIAMAKEIAIVETEKNSSTFC